MTFLLLIWLALAPPITLRAQSYVFPGVTFPLRIHVRYAESDRWLKLSWSPDDVGNSEMPVSPKEFSTRILFRRIDRPGVYVARASVGAFNHTRAFSDVRIEVLGEQ